MRIHSSFFVFVLLFLTACGGSSGTKGIGSAGGVVTSDDGLAVLTIPVNALQSPVEISLKLDPSTNPDVNYGIYILEPAGTSFAVPARLDITLKDYSDNNLEFSPSFMFLESADSVDAVENQSNILKDKDLLISGDIPHFSRVVWIEQTGIRWRGTEPPATVVKGGSFLSAITLSTDTLNIINGKAFVLQENKFPLLPSETPDQIATDSELGTLVERTDSLFSGGIFSFCDDNLIGLGEFAPRVVLLNWKLKEGLAEELFSSLASGGDPNFIEFLVIKPIPDGIIFKMGIERPVRCVENDTPPDSEPPEDSIVVVAEPDPINVIHSFGVSPCPQEIGTITVTNNSDNTVIPLDIVIPAGAALSTDPSEGSVFPGESRAVKIFFTCATTSGVNNIITVNGKTTGVIVDVQGEPEE